MSPSGQGALCVANRPVRFPRRAGARTRPPRWGRSVDGAQAAHDPPAAVQRGDDCVDAGPDLDSRTLALRRSIRRGAAEQRDENAPSQVEHGLPPAKGATSINISTREFAAARWKRASPWRARTARYRALARPLATQGISPPDSTRPSPR